MGSYSDVGFHRFVEGRQGPTYELWCEEEAAEGEHRGERKRPNGRGEGGEGRRPCSFAGSSMVWRLPEM